MQGSGHQCQHFRINKAAHGGGVAMEGRSGEQVSQELLTQRASCPILPPQGEAPSLTGACPESSDQVS